MKLPIAPQPSHRGNGTTHPLKDKWQRLLSEPLLHFLILGVLLFGAYRVVSPEPKEAVDSQRIELTRDDIRQLAVAWLAQGRGPPTADQLRSLVDQKVTEEILFREAVALGLDRDDQIVKRRLAQKMDFLAADLAATQEPSDAELLEWFSKNADRFKIPPRVSFRHLYFSPDRRGVAARDSAESAIDLIAGKPADSPEVAAVADPFMFHNYYSNSTPEQLVKEFGASFAAELLRLEPGSWQGPVQSGYGWHLVWIDSIVPGRIPSFVEVKPDVRSAWLDYSYQQVKRSAIQEMRSHYTIVVVPLDTVDLRDLNGSLNGTADSGSVSQ